MNTHHAFAASLGLLVVTMAACDGSLGGPGPSTTTGTTAGGTTTPTGSGGTATGTETGGTGGAAGTGGVGAGNTGGTGGQLPTCDTSGAQDCSPGPGQGTADQCFDLQPQFGNQVNAAIDGVIANHPSWFDTDQGAACCPLVLEYDLYVQTVAADLAGYGLCAIQDPNAGDEMPVKRNNNCAEQYDILTSQGFVRRPPGGYNGTCIPAWF